MTAIFVEDKPTRPAPEPVTGERPPRGDHRVLNAFSHTILVGWAVLTTFPLLWAVLSSFKTDEEILTDAWSLPSALRVDNWVRAWNEAHIGRYFLNSAIVVAGALTLTMLLGAMAAYVLARYDIRGGRFIYYLFVGGMMFPVFLALVPLFFVLKNAQWTLELRPAVNAADSTERLDTITSVLTGGVR